MNSSTKSAESISSKKHHVEYGWECPRCGHINAPWVRQCDCSPSSTISWDKITVNPCDEWWKTQITGSDEWWKTQVTGSENTFKIHPESTVYTTNVNQVVGGSDYKDSATGNWVNIPKTYTNSVKR